MYKVSKHTYVPTFLILFTASFFSLVPLNFNNWKSGEILCRQVLRFTLNIDTVSTVNFATEVIWLSVQ